MCGAGLTALCVVVACGLAQAASVPDSSGCSGVRSLLLAKGVDESSASQADDAGAGVCGSASYCCPGSLEHGLRDVVQREFRKTLHNRTDQLQSLLLEQAVRVQDTILAVIQSARQSTMETFIEAYPRSATLIRQPMNAFFDAFLQYFQSQRSDPELEEAVTLFFDDLFPLSYKEAAHPLATSLNETLAACLRERRAELRPFKDAPFRMKEKMLRVFGIAKFYLQSLYVGVEVLNTTTQLEYSSSCYDALTRLSYCSFCHGLSQVKPCSGFCYNVMRGCMAPLSTLSDAWSNYVGVLRRLGTSLQQSNDIKEFLFKMHMNVAEAMVNVWHNKDHIEATVMEVCSATAAQASPQSARLRREIPLLSYQPSGPSTAQASPQSARLRREIPLLPYQPSGDLELALPQRHQSLSSASPGAPALASILRTFNGQVEQHRGLFSSLADTACTEGVYGEEVECWNGTRVGDYEHPLAGVGLDSQAFNPEVKVPQMADPVLEEKADRLERIRQISHDKTLVMPPSDDLHGYDRAWTEGSGSGGGLDYDDEDGVYDYFDGYNGGSGSGDGSMDDIYQEGVDEEDDVDTGPSPARPADEDVQKEPKTELPVPQVPVTTPTTAAPPIKASGASASAACCALLLVALLASRS